MTTKENDNFLDVKPYRFIPLKVIYEQKLTRHANFERLARLKLAGKLNAFSGIDKVFLVDKGHEDGKEIHCVSRRGIIFILNEQKFLHNKSCLITVQIARTNQVLRLYKACNFYCPQRILQYTRFNEIMGYNK